MGRLLNLFAALFLMTTPAYACDARFTQSDTKATFQSKFGCLSRENEQLQAKVIALHGSIENSRSCASSLAQTYGDLKAQLACFAYENAELQKQVQALEQASPPAPPNVSAAARVKLPHQAAPTRAVATKSDAEARAEQARKVQEDADQKAAEERANIEAQSKLVGSWIGTFGWNDGAAGSDSWVFRTNNTFGDSYTNSGTWVKNGDNFVVRFSAPPYSVYTGTISDDVFSGSMQADNGKKGTFTMKRAQ